MALDALSLMHSELKKLDKQVNDKVNYESEWSYGQLVKMKNHIIHILIHFITGKIP
jgi:hypothetical protein